MDAARSPRSLEALVVIVTACALAFAGFVALGIWQVQRLAWKQALIARVDARVQAEPVVAPGPAQWDALPDGDAYRRVRARGRYEPAREVLVAATTELGAGFWVLTPLKTEAGHWLLVNRGFVPPELRTQVPRPPQEASVTGLLRITEPGGRMLQQNDAASGRWYSRDVAAIARTQQLAGPVAPYFVDAQPASASEAAGWPRPGLTVIRFRNHHLVYALTWFALAAMSAAAAGYLLLDARRARLRMEA